MGKHDETTDGDQTRRGSCIQPTTSPTYMPIPPAAIRDPSATHPRLEQLRQSLPPTGPTCHLLPALELTRPILSRAEQLRLPAASSFCLFQTGIPFGRRSPPSQSCPLIVPSSSLLCPSSLHPSIPPSLHPLRLPRSMEAGVLGAPIGMVLHRPSGISPARDAGLSVPRAPGYRLVSSQAPMSRDPASHTP